MYAKKRNSANNEEQKATRPLKGLKKLLFRPDQPGKENVTQQNQTA
jgi:hypothetical protein